LKLTYVQHDRTTPPTEPTVYQKYGLSCFQVSYVLLFGSNKKRPRRDFSPVIPRGQDHEELGGYRDREECTRTTTTSEAHPREGHLRGMRRDHQDADRASLGSQGLRRPDVLLALQPAFPGNARNALLQLGAVGVIRSIASGLLFAAPSFVLILVTG
jgi:hypothetical protein